jgi:hypothetical protein
VWEVTDWGSFVFAVDCLSPPCGQGRTDRETPPPPTPSLSLRLSPGPRPAEGPAAWEVLAARIIHHCHTVGDTDGKLADVTRQLESVAKQNYEKVSLGPPTVPGPGR